MGERFELTHALDMDPSVAHWVRRGLMDFGLFLGLGPTLRAPTL